MSTAGAAYREAESRNELRRHLDMLAQWARADTNPDPQYDYTEDDIAGLRRDAVAHQEELMDELTTKIYDLEAELVAAGECNDKCGQLDISARIVALEAQLAELEADDN